MKEKRRRDDMSLPSEIFLDKERKSVSRKIITLKALFKQNFCFSIQYICSHSDNQCDGDFLLNSLWFVCASLLNKSVEDIASIEPWGTPWLIESNLILFYWNHSHNRNCFQYNNLTLVSFVIIFCIH